MCLWLITACLGLLPTNPPPPNVIVIQGVPTPILQPTTAATTATTSAPPTAPSNATTTTARPAPPGNMTSPPPPPSNMTSPSPAPGNMTSPSPAPGNMTSPPPPPGNNTGTPPTMMTTITARPPNATTAAPAPPPTNATTAATLATPTPAPTMMPTTAPSPATTGGMLLPVLLCDNPDVICISNPDESASGSLSIDPRLGTTPGSSAALQSPLITGYSAQVPSYDTAVRFPRERRSVDFNLLDLFGAHGSLEGEKHKIRKRQACRCVPSGTCIRTSSGAGMIDIRIVTPGATQCPAGQEYCCGNTTTQAMIACGTLQTVASTVTVPAAGQASFGEFPWQALILTKQNDYLAGGVLIDSLNVLTVTHRLTSYIVSGTAPNVKVRLGEWDAAGTYEPIPYQEYTVQKVFSHPSFNANTLQYDITVLRLSAPVPFTPANGSTTTINRACLPAASSSIYNGLRCLVSGWGKDMFGISGRYQQIIKKVEVPIVAPATCQSQMQTARLGPTFALDTTSFICAGGEANKDACTGDGGSGLVCQVNGQWVVVGLVAWGLGCANANVPAAYVNVAALLPWIQQQVAAA